MRQTTNKFRIFGIDFKIELIATFNPLFLEIKRRGLKILKIRNIFNLSKLISVNRKIETKLIITIKKSN